MARMGASGGVQIFTCKCGQKFRFGSLRCGGCRAASPALNRHDTAMIFLSLTLIAAAGIVSI